MSMSPAVVILYLVSNIFYTLGINNIMNVFFAKRRSSRAVMILTYALYFVLASAERILFNTDIMHMSVVLPVLFIITHNYESSVLKRLVAAAANYLLFCVVSDFLVILIKLLSIRIDTNYIWHYLPAALLSYAISLLFGRFTHIKQHDPSTPLFWVSALFALAPTIPFVIFYSMHLPPAAELIFFLLMIGANLLIFYLYDTLSQSYEEKMQVALFAKEKEYYLSQFRLMQESLDNMKSYRHDIKLHLAALLDYSAENTAASDYLNKLIGEIDAGDTISHTGNMAFDSIINYKLNHARELNIRTYAQLLIPRDLRVEVADVVTILGNLLDNAVDAALRAEFRLIKLSVVYRNGNLFIKIQNTYDGVINYDKDTRIITRKDGENHGQGLKSVQRCAEKYNGHVEITHDEKIFSAAVLLYLE